MNQPSAEQIAKLPKWAQEHINTLEIQRDAAIRTLNSFQDSQTPSPIYFDDILSTGEKEGPSAKRCYVHTQNLVIEHAGVWLDIHLARENDGQRDYGIQLTWGQGGNHLCGGYACFIPKGFQSAQIIAKAQMRER